MSERDPTDIRAQERARKTKDDLDKLASRQEAEDFKWLMSDKRGRRFIWGLLEDTGVYRSSFTGNSETFFREGARNVGLKLIAMIHEHSPEKYNLMVTEHNEHERRSAEHVGGRKH